MGVEGDQSAPLTPSGLTPSVPDPSRLTSPDPLIPLIPPAPLNGSGIRGVMLLTPWSLLTPLTPPTPLTPLTPP